MDPSSKTRHCSCTKFVNECISVFLYIFFYIQWKYHLWFHALSSLFYINCQLNGVGFYSFFYCSGMLYKIYYLLSMPRCLYCASTRELSHLRREQTHISLLMLTRDTCWWREAVGTTIQASSGECTHFFSPPFSLIPISSLFSLFFP